MDQFSSLMANSNPPDLQQSLQSLMAVIAAANSPPGLNSPGGAPVSVPPPINSTPIPSPQSAFALLRHPEPSTTSNGLLSVMDPAYTQSAFSPRIFPASPVPTTNYSYSPFVPNFQHPQANASSNLVEHLKLLASSIGFDPNSIIAKIQQQLVDIPTPSNLPAITTNHHNIPPLPFNPPQQTSCTTESLRQSFNRAFEASTANNKGLDSTKHPSSSSSSQNLSQPHQQQQQQSPKAQVASNDIYPPPRKIRRRRAKSPSSSVKAKRSSSTCSSTFDVDEGACFASPLKSPPKPLRPVSTTTASTEEPNRLTEGPMSTPDDPIINSPPSLLQRGSVDATAGDGRSNLYAPEFQQPQSPNEGYGMSKNAGKNRQLSIDDCDSKKCLVCSDKATGYNFNVITCESCKAFFRRNANRPKGGKDFKCPYSDACDINTISRRFCQKCRLRKCFDVGMRSDWILNEDQLKRRKNSRLNNVKGGHGSPMERSPSSMLGSPVTSPGSVTSNQSAMHLGSPIKIELQEQVEGRQMKVPHRRRTQRHSITEDAVESKCGSMDYRRQSLFAAPSIPSLHLATQAKIEAQSTLPSPISNNHHLVSPFKPAVSQSLSDGIHRIEQSQLAILQQQQQQLLQRQMAHFGGVPSSHILPSNNKEDGQTSLSLKDLEHFRQLNSPRVDLNGRASALPTLPMPGNYTSLANNYNQQQRVMTQLATTPPAISPMENHASYASRSVSFSQATPTATTTVSQGFPEPMSVSEQISSSVFSSDMEQQMHRMKGWFEETIHDALNSPDGIELPDYGSIMQDTPAVNEPKMNYQLNSHEVRQMDIVKSAFACFEEDVGKTPNVDFGKADQTCVDILNIIDIAMRRFVKVAKKLPSFNDISADGKLSLLKASMIDLITIRGVSKFDTKNNCWKSETLGNNANISFDFFNKTNDKDQKERFVHFYTTLHQSIRHNEFSMKLITLIALFDRAQLLVEEADKLIGKRYYENYLNLLKRHLESTLSADEAQTIMATVRPALKELQAVSSKASTLFVGKVRTGECDLAPLPTEFFKTSPAEDDSAVMSADDPPSCSAMESS